VITTFDVLLNIGSFDPGNETRGNKYVVYASSIVSFASRNLSIPTFTK